MSKKREQSLAADVGRRLRSIRRHNGWSQKEAADRIGATTSQLSRWESGKILPNTETLIDIRDGFTVSTDEIILGLGTIHGELIADPDLRALARSIEQLPIQYRNEAREMLRSIVAKAREDLGLSKLTARADPAATPKKARR
jgi:transcriptional regulator with XRE-family HTH domain